MSPSLCDQLERVPLVAVLVVLAGFVYLGNLLEEGTNTWFEVRRFDKVTVEGGKGKGQHCVYILFLSNVLQSLLIFEFNMHTTWMKCKRLYFIALIFLEWQCKWNIFSFFVPRRHIKYGELTQMVERPLSMRVVPRSMPGFSTFIFICFYFVDWDEKRMNSNDFQFSRCLWFHPWFNQFKLFELDPHHYVKIFGSWSSSDKGLLISGVSARSWIIACRSSEVISSWRVNNPVTIDVIFVWIVRLKSWKYEYNPWLNLSHRHYTSADSVQASLAFEIAARF